MNSLEMKGYEVPLKHYTLKDLGADRPLFLKHAIETADHFVCPQYLNRGYEFELQMSILIPKDLPAGLFEINQKLDVNLWSFAFDTEKVRSIKWQKTMLEGNIIFGDFRERTQLGRTFELKLPTEAKHILFISDQRRLELTEEAFTSLKNSATHFTYQILSIDNGIIEFGRFSAVLRNNQFFGKDCAIRNSSELAELYADMYSDREDEILTELGIGISEAACAKAEAIEAHQISAKNRPFFLDRLNRLQEEIDDLAKTPGVYQHALPCLNYESHSTFNYVITERAGESRRSGYDRFYTEENVRTAEIDIRNSLEEIRLSVNRINHTIKILEELLAPGLEKLKKYNVFLLPPNRDRCEVWLMHRAYRPGYSSNDIIGIYKFSSVFQYDEELLTIPAEELATRIAEQFRPRIEEKLYAIKAIEKINRVARAYNRDNPDLPEQNPRLSPRELIFGS